MKYVRTASQETPAKKRRRPARALRAALALFVAALLIFSGGCKKKADASPVGAWHSEELNQMLRFHDDGTVVIRTAVGDAEATYVFDSGSSNGVITLSGQAIAFTLEDETLTLTANGEENVFIPGEMAIASPSPEATEPETTQTAAEEAAGSAPTPAPTATATPAPTAAPTATPAATATATPTPIPTYSFGLIPGLSFMPIATPTPSVSFHIVIPSGILGNVIIGTSVVGDWYYQSNNNWVLTFNSDNTCSLAYNGSGYTGTYTYNSAAGTGVLNMEGTSVSFSVSGDMLTWTNGSGAVFTR